MDSSTESPLDVLSRAATMLQDNAPLPPSYGDNEIDVEAASTTNQTADVGSRHPVYQLETSATYPNPSCHNQGSLSRLSSDVLVHPPSFPVPSASHTGCLSSCYMDMGLHGQDNCHFLVQPWYFDGDQTFVPAAAVSQTLNLAKMADEARFHLKCKEMAAAAANGGKWKRERRSRPATATPPAYPLKTAQISQHPEPIDMSTRKMRGSPPSYSQTISAGYINRPSTNQPTNSSITNSNATTDTDMNGGDVAAEDSSMPVIDEHFRRSLGKHYQSVFAPSAASGATSSSPPSSTASTRQRITSNGQTTDDSSSDSAADNNAGSALSVDEHFAKALGDTWLKLQQKEKTASITNGGGGGSSSTNHHHSSSSSSSTMTITTTTNSPLVLVPSSPTEHALLRLNRIEP